MGECWAASLGDCSDKISREHIVSAGLFSGEQIDVVGFPWCKNHPKRIGLANLTAKILCERHNHELSRIDDAGARAFRTFREADHLLTVRERLSKRFWHIKRFRIDGRSLERWFLKTLINISFGREYPIGETSEEKGRPSSELVEVAFGRRPFGAKGGLYTVVHVGQKIRTSDIVKFKPLLAREGPRVVGGLFVFRGFRFLLYLNADGPPQKLRGVAFEDEDWGISDLQFHNRAIRTEITGRLSHVVEVKW